MRAAIAKALVQRTVERLPLRLALPDGTLRGGAQGDPVLRLNRPEAFYAKLGRHGLIGFGESYQDGDWDCDELPQALAVLAAHVETIVPRGLQWIRRFYAAALPRSEASTLANAQHNIARHYDLSNQLFASFLDETMTYSSALFGESPATWEGLADAQRRKIDRLLDLTSTGPGTRLLEIGTGWGELAVRAAKRGAIVHTVTLSEEQRAYARTYAESEGVAERVDVRLCDYRLIPGEQAYDVIVSVEMIEAVGERYWPDYFAALRRLLAPGGRIGLQAITMAHHRMLATRNTYTWIQKYIFPGGLIPSVEAIERLSGLPVLGKHAFGSDYAETLRLWRERFLAQASYVDSIGFDERFRRTWELYLAYSEAGFASGYLNVHQFLLGAHARLKVAA
ncbi:SAM-dependent methyltransferase [Catelliglobosispora koreensis]|uniref:SAM-dependent methyltransferase n=1 Tax=Catelliglobosispora koreensis TaxID=129052 RepID=UPI00037D428C|nr:cyclopropane-fatty-acyl-phospholipid synthase family protein [Catelliglobosispora koreensis]